MNFRTPARSPFCTSPVSVATSASAPVMSDWASVAICLSTSAVCSATKRGHVVAIRFDAAVMASSAAGASSTPSAYLLAAPKISTVYATSTALR